MRSTFSIAFRDKGGTIVQQHGLDPVFDTPDGKSDLTGVSVIAPMPAGTAQVTFERGGRILQTVPCDGVAPVVSKVAVGSSANDVVTLKWNASRPRARDVRYNVSFSRHDKRQPLLLAAGLRDTHWNAARSSLPGTDQGTFVVTASDGCNVTTTKAGPIIIARRLPIVPLRVNYPDTASARAEAVTVGGVAWDHTDGVIGGESLEWFIDGRSAGRGQILVLPRRLPAYA